MDSFTIPSPVECPQCGGHLDTMVEFRTVERAPKLTKWCAHCGPVLPIEIEASAPVVADSDTVAA